MSRDDPTTWVYYDAPLARSVKAVSMSTGPVGVEESYNGGATSARPLPRSPEIKKKKPEIKCYWGGFGAHMSGIPKSFSVGKNGQKRKSHWHHPQGSTHDTTRHTRRLAATAKSTPILR